MAAATSSPSIIAQLFTAAGIERVVFVDDRFGITTERIQSLANDLSIEELVKSTAFPASDLASDDEDVTRRIVTNTIGTATPEDLSVMFEKMAAVEYDYGDADRDRKAAEYFRTVVASSAEIEIGRASCRERK